MNSRWGIYLKERFPVIPNFLIALGLTQSIRILCRGLSVETPALASWFGVIGGMLFLAQLRFMDEYKDFEKDKIAHPERPLPRGLFTHDEFGMWITRFNIAMVLFSVLCMIFLNLASGILFALGTVYLYLMFVEFYVGKWLSDRPLLYAITHQAILFPLGAFAFACFWPDGLNQPYPWRFCFLLLGTFFGFEVGRKLDPNSNPILKTYLYLYGKKKTTALLLLMLGISTFAAWKLYIFALLGPLYFLIALSTPLLWKKPEKFKIIEGLVVLYLLVAIWAIPLKSLIWGNYP